MRSRSYRWWCLGTVMFGLVSGCQEVALPTGLDGNTQPTDTELAEAGGNSGGEAVPGDDLAAQAASYAERVQQMQADSQQPAQMQQIMWRDVGGEQQVAGGVNEVEAGQPTQELVTQVSAMEAMSTTPPDAPDAVAVSDTQAAGNDVQAVPVIDVSGQTTAKQTKPVPSIAQAYSQLLEAVRHGDDSNLSKALAAATLAPIGPHGELDWSLLNKLSPEDQQRIKNYHRAVSMLHAQLLSGEGEMDREAIAGGLDQLYGDRPVTIRNIRLCEKVMGYGVYDAFPDHTFVAGREQKLIVYVELDNFEPMQNQAGGGYEVRLRQELELYESNGFEVWSHEPVVITDVSQNKRRDFFVVQLVTLPAQLRMGQYHLKIRVYDENGGTRDEASLELRLVADGALVKEEVRSPGR